MKIFFFKNVTFVIITLLMCLAFSANSQNTNPWPSSGSVGIGTISPGAPLEIKSNSPTTGKNLVIKLTNGWNGSNPNNEPTIFFDNGLGSAQWLVGASVAGGDYFRVSRNATYSGAVNPGLSEYFRIHADGNVGINTSLPLARLHVNGSAIIGSTTLPSTFDLASNRIVLGNQTSVSGGYIEVNNSVAYGYNIVSKSNIALANVPSKLFIGLNTNANKEVFGVYSDGQTYIGPQIIASSSIHTDYKLSVDGKIVAKSIYVLLPTGGDWADYVFQDNYKLTPLKEIEMFIKKNKHLPEIPSVKEIEQNGVNLGQMDALLLKKIEELTLHLIRIEKENENLKKQIEGIVNRL